MEDEPSFSKEIVVLAENLQQLTRQFVLLGGFDDSRELLTCPKCRLYEDVTFAGLLIVLESNTSNGIDIGLRFSQISENEWLCPKCDLIFISEISGELIDDLLLGDRDELN